MASLTAEATMVNDIAPGWHKRWARRFVGLISIVTGLLIWEAVSRLIIANSLFLAAPSQVAIAIVQLAATGELEHHMAVSGFEFIVGYVIACILGVILGFAMASSEIRKEALQPWVSGLYATPTIALAPLFILWTGIGLWSKVLVWFPWCCFRWRSTPKPACAPPASV